MSMKNVMTEAIGPWLSSHPRYLEMAQASASVGLLLATVQLLSLAYGLCVEKIIMFEMN